MSSDSLNSPTETISGKWSGRLTPERIKLLAECLIAGCTRKETAEALRVSESSVSRWKTDPRVLAEVERRRNRTFEERVLDVLEHLLDSDDERVALAAVQAALRRIERAPVKSQPSAVVIRVTREEELEFEKNLAREEELARKEGIPYEQIFDAGWEEAKGLTRRVPG